MNEDIRLKKCTSHLMVVSGLVIEGLRIVFQEDLFFEVTHPEEIKYTYRIAHASDFGTGFVSDVWNIF